MYELRKWGERRGGYSSDAVHAHVETGNSFVVLLVLLVMIVFCVPVGASTERVQDLWLTYSKGFRICG
jgi:hypothetical protein